MAQELEYRTSRNGIAELLTKAGKFSEICPFTLSQPIERLGRSLCPVSGCTGKLLCPVLAQEGKCEKLQCRSDGGNVQIRQSCSLEVVGERCFDWSYEHRDWNAHRGEYGGEEEWACREASAKLRAAHEKRLWLTSGVSREATVASLPG